MSHSLTIIKGQIFLDASDIQKVIDLPLPNEYLPFKLLEYPFYKLLGYSHGLIDYSHLIDLLPYSRGKADILVTWNNGTLEGFRVIDGKIIKCNVVVMLEPEEPLE